MIETKLVLFPGHGWVLLKSVSHLDGYVVTAWMADDTLDVARVAITKFHFLSAVNKKSLLTATFLNLVRRLEKMKGVNP